MTRFLRHSIPLTVAMAAIAALLLTGAPIASAHATELEHGNDYVVTDANHRTAAVCDAEKDGNYVIAYWYDADVGLIDREEDGGDSGCDQITLGQKATYVQLCEYPDVSCTETHRV